MCQSSSLSLKILIIIKSECIDFDKKRVTKNVSLKTNTKNVLCWNIKFLNSRIVKDFLSFFKNIFNFTKIVCWTRIFEWVFYRTSSISKKCCEKVVDQWEYFLNVALGSHCGSHWNKNSWILKKLHRNTFIAITYF